MNCFIRIFLLKFTAGLDYESLNQVLTFPANTTILTQCVNITILQDSAVESFVEFFNVLANSTSISVTPASVMILIQEDNDRKLLLHILQVVPHACTHCST